MLEALKSSMSSVLSRLKGRPVLSERDIEDALKDIRIALIEADVSLSVVKDFLDDVRKNALGASVVKTVTSGQMVVKIVHDTLVNMLGEKNEELDLKASPPAVVLMAGLQGSGKTTTTAKLALFLKNKVKKKVLMASTDVYRPAAKEQLKILGEKNEIPTLDIVANERPVLTVSRALKEAKLSGYDVLLIDTAGRLHIDASLMEELREIKTLSSPVETLLVADALSGQDALQVAKDFNEKLGVSGIVLTRMDGDSRGGAALSMRKATGCPIKFLGVGEAADALEPFHPDRLAGRILDMGDIVSLVEKAAEKMDEDEAEKLAQRMMEGKFNLNDLLSQLRQMKKMGDMKGILSMLPGLSGFQKQIDAAKLDDKVFNRQEAIILSMTPGERKNPDLLKASRKQRVADGAGVSVADVNKLLKQYDQMAQMMKQLKKLGPLAGLMGGGGMGMPALPKGLAGGGFPPFRR